METIYALPTWAETTLVICIALMLSGLAAWLACKAIAEALDAESKLEHKRRESEAEALNKWQKLYEEEKKHRLEAISDLIGENLELEKENKTLLKRIEEKDKLLAKARLADL